MSVLETQNKNSVPTLDFTFDLSFYSGNYTGSSETIQIPTSFLDTFGEKVGSEEKAFEQYTGFSHVHLLHWTSEESDVYGNGVDEEELSSQQKHLQALQAEHREDCSTCASLSQEAIFMEEEEASLLLCIITEPKKHYKAKWKFEHAFPLDYEERNYYRHRSLNENSYSLPLEQQEAVEQFLHSMKQDQEIVDFFIDDGTGEGYAPRQKNRATRQYALQLALQAMRYADTQNVFQSEYVVQVIIDALKHARAEN